MSSYLGRHAELYDLFYAEKPYQQEAEFVHHCLQRYTDERVRRVLELACGTGEHAFELERNGYEIVATDYSEDMLEQARQKASKRKSNISFRIADMRSLDVADKLFDAVVCLFDSIGYVRTNQAIRNVLNNVYEHLKPKGLFVFEFWHAAAMLRNFDPVRVRRWSVPDGKILRISETELDHKNQLAHVTYSIFELHADNTYSSFQETQTNRFFLLQEMKILLEGSGFEAIKWFDGFQEDENITDETWHILAVARRK